MLFVNYVGANGGTWNMYDGAGWNKNDKIAGVNWGNLVAHEAGHLMGLIDRYTDVKDRFGKVLYSQAHAHWGGNIMSGPPGVAWNQNLSEMINFARAHRHLQVIR